MNTAFLVLQTLLLLSCDPDNAIRFDTEIIPVLTKAGCNSGACHGAAAGRGGFHLSLLGTDAPADYEAVVHALEGRRINVAHPERSLILTKPTGQLDHGGEVVLEVDGPGARRLLEWIRLGAARGPVRKLAHIEVTPVRKIVEPLPAEVSLKVSAAFDDGPAEDVTRWTVFTSSDPASVSINAHNIAEVRRRGQHVIIARFLDRVIPIQITSPLSDVPVNLADQPRTSFIDDEILRVLSELRLPVSPMATDAAWMRRVSLDLTGCLPEPDDVQAFLIDDSRDKRLRYVEELLNSDAFADYWTLRFSKLLRIHSLPNEKEGVSAYAGWLRQEIYRGTPWNEMARDLLTAVGDSHTVGPANFGRMVGDARAHAELVGQVFLGMRLGCANCHNHPLDKWTQDDYHGLAAVFSRLDRGREVRMVTRGAVTNPRTGDPAIPRIPGERYLIGDGDHRESIAEWLTSGGNQYLARAMVNRLWKAMFGRGLVEPTDDLRETNPSTHPELLDQLAENFAMHRYSIRHTLKLLALSSTYARSSAVAEGNEIDDRFYSHAYHRSLEPEVLMDAIADVTGVASEFSPWPSGTRAVAIVDSLQPAPSLDILGRCRRAGGCDENGSQGGGLTAELHLLNGDLINSRVTDPAGRLHQQIAKGSSDEEIVRDFYRRAFSRPVSDNELAFWKERLADNNSQEHVRKLEDFVWSLLNSRLFRENQ